MHRALIRKSLIYQAMRAPVEEKTGCGCIAETVGQPAYVG